MGVGHEQSRPDRDQYVTIKFENIKKGLEGEACKAPSIPIDSCQFNFPLISTILDQFRMLPASQFSVNGIPYETTSVNKQNIGT